MRRHAKKAVYILFSLILISGVFGIGVYLGYSHRPEIEKVVSVTNKEPSISTKADFNSFWKVWNVLNEKSIYKDKATDQDRVWGAIKGMAQSFGDPYTVFFSPEENKLFNEEIHGSFGGIGAEIGIKDKILTIVSPLKNSPALSVGIKSGDKILKIDKTDTTDMTVDKAINLIRGPEGSTVTLTILRPGERLTREFKIVRANIEIPTIDTEFRSDNIFVIKFYSFSENSANPFRNT
jgi:carboxyl-terminal processing protease